MRASCVCSINIYASFFFFFNSSMSSSRRSHVNLFFANEETGTKKVGSWRKMHLRHTSWPCSWRQRHRLLCKIETKWLRPRRWLPYFQTSIFRRVRMCAACACLHLHFVCTTFACGRRKPRERELISAVTKLSAPFTLQLQKSSSARFNVLSGIIS